jgi:uncharacterized protein (DUF1778 family)
MNLRIEINRRIKELEARVKQINEELVDQASEISDTVRQELLDTIADYEHEIVELKNALDKAVDEAVDEAKDLYDAGEAFTAKLKAFCKRYWPWLTGAGVIILVALALIIS